MCNSENLPDQARHIHGKKQTSKRFVIQITEKSLWCLLSDISSNPKVQWVRVKVTFNRWGLHMYLENLRNVNVATCSRIQRLSLNKPHPLICHFSEMKAVNTIFRECLPYPESGWLWSFHHQRWKSPPGFQWWPYLFDRIEMALILYTHTETHKHTHMHTHACVYVYDNPL